MTCSAYADFRVKQEVEEAKEQAAARAAAAAAPVLTTAQLKKQQHAAKMQKLRAERELRLAAQASVAPPAGTYTCCS